MEKEDNLLIRSCKMQKRVGTDITLGGNINPMEVYNSD